MAATHILVLKPNVARHEALQTFSSPRLGTIYWRIRSGPLQRIGDAYVPYWLYRVRYNIGRVAHASLFAIDAVNGSLDLFTFPSIPTSNELVSIHTRNCIAPLLQKTDAKTVLHHKVLRVIFQQGFFKVRDLRLEIEPDSLDLHIPYWLGFYGNGTAHCRVLNAVRRRMEGAKASAMFESWLAA